RARGGPDLHPAGRAAAGDRAGRGSHQPAPTAGAAGAAGDGGAAAAAAAADGRGAGRAAAAPDAAGGDRLELRAAAGGRAAAVPTALGLPRRVHARGGRGGRRRGPRTRDHGPGERGAVPPRSSVLGPWSRRRLRGDRLAAPEEPGPAERGGGG